MTNQIQKSYPARFDICRDYTTFSAPAKVGDLALHLPPRENTRIYDKSFDRMPLDEQSAIDVRRAEVVKKLTGTDGVTLPEDSYLIYNVYGNEKGKCGDMCVRTCGVPIALTTGISTYDVITNFSNHTSICLLGDRIQGHFKISRLSTGGPTFTSVKLLALIPTATDPLGYGMNMQFVTVETGITINVPSDWSTETIQADIDFTLSNLNANYPPICRLALVPSTNLSYSNYFSIDAIFSEDIPIFLSFYQWTRYDTNINEGYFNFFTPIFSKNVPEGWTETTLDQMSLRMNAGRTPSAKLRPVHDQSYEYPPTFNSPVLLPQRKINEIHDYFDVNNSQIAYYPEVGFRERRISKSGEYFAWQRGTAQAVYPYTQNERSLLTLSYLRTPLKTLTFWHHGNYPTLDEDGNPNPVDIEVYKVNDLNDIPGGGIYGQVTWDPNGTVSGTPVSTFTSKCTLIYSSPYSSFNTHQKYLLTLSDSPGGDSCYIIVARTRMGRGNWYFGPNMGGIVVYCATTPLYCPTVSITAVDKENNVFVHLKGGYLPSSLSPIGDWEWLPAGSSNGATIKRFKDIVEVPEGQNSITIPWTTYQKYHADSYPVVTVRFNKPNITEEGSWRTKVTFNNCYNGNRVIYTACHAKDIDILERLTEGPCWRTTSALESSTPTTVSPNHCISGQPYLTSIVSYRSLWNQLYYTKDPDSVTLELEKFTPSFSSYLPGVDGILTLTAVSHVPGRLFVFTDPKNYIGSKIATMWIGYRRLDYQSNVYYSDINSPSTDPNTITQNYLYYVWDTLSDSALCAEYRGYFIWRDLAGRIHKLLPSHVEAKGDKWLQYFSGAFKGSYEEDTEKITKSQSGNVMKFIKQQSVSVPAESGKRIYWYFDSLTAGNATFSSSFTANP